MKNNEELQTSRPQAEEIFEKHKKSGIISTDKQFGKKIGKHAMDYSLDPSRPEDRERMWFIVEDICSAATETSKLMIIYSKTGTHLVPRKENKQ